MSLLMRRASLAVPAMLTVLVPLALLRGQGMSTAAIPAAHPVGAVLATSPAVFKSVTSLVTLSDGRVLINDGSARQLVMLDAKLTPLKTLLDSTAGGAASYGTVGGGLLPYVADSSLFVDRTAKALMVVDPSGRIARTTPVPTASSYLYLTATSPLYGFPGVSPSLGLVFESPLSLKLPPRPAPGTPDVVVLTNDTSAVLTFNMATRKVDTIAQFSTGRGVPMRISATGITSDVLASITSPFRWLDGWVMTSDGSIAVVRGRDYRIDWINPDRTTASGPRIAHEWQHNTDEGKVQVSDSLNAIVARADSTSLALFLKDSIDVAAGTGTTAQIARMHPADIASLLAASGASAELLATAGALPPRPTIRARPTPGRRLTPGDIPDYMPAVETLSGSIRADGDNNVWVRIRPAVRQPDVVVWDVINRKGVLVDRVAVPTAMTVVGFSTGGIMYVQTRDAGALHLQKVQWKK